MLTFALAGGSWVFLGFLLLIVPVVAFSYYSRSGGDITYRGFQGRGDVDPSALSDRTQAVRDWSRGTGGSHRRNLPRPSTDRTMRSKLDPRTAAELRAWRDGLGSGKSGTLAVPVDQDRDHVRGPADAQVTVVAYSDFQCPSCHEVDIVMRDLVDQTDGLVRYVFRHFPLADAHDTALEAAETAEWAHTQGRFWDTHDAIYRARHEPTPATLRKAVAKLGMDPAELDRALTGSEFRDRVAEDFDSGVRSGVNGTPSIYINGQRYDDFQDAEPMRRAVLAAVA